MNDRQIQIPSWALPLIVVALAVPIIAAFAIGGPGLGLAVGALAAVAIVTVAVRQRPRGPISPPGESHPATGCAWRRASGSTAPT